MSSFENIEKTDFLPRKADAEIAEESRCALSDEAFCAGGFKKRVDGEIMKTGDVLIHQDRIVMPSGQELLVGSDDWTLMGADGEKLASSENYPNDGTTTNQVLANSHIGILAEPGHWTIAYPKGDLIELQKNDSLRESGMNVTITRDGQVSETGVVNLKQVSKSMNSQWR